MKINPLLLLPVFLTALFIPITVNALSIRCPSLYIGIKFLGVVIGISGLAMLLLLFTALLFGNKYSRGRFKFINNAKGALAGGLFFVANFAGSYGIALSLVELLGSPAINISSIFILGIATVLFWIGTFIAIYSFSKILRNAWRSLFFLCNAIIFIGAHIFIIYAQVRYTWLRSLRIHGGHDICTISGVTDFSFGLLFASLAIYLISITTVLIIASKKKKKRQVVI